MKKYVSFLCIFFVICLCVSPVYATESEIELHSQYAYLYDRETTVSYIDKKSEEKIYPASMTKILTAVIALEKIDNIKEKVVVKQEDIDGLLALQATTAGFNPGEKVTYEDLLYGAMFPSGADACNTLARLTYGSLDKMVEVMNKKVSELKLKKTHFMNVTGLHDDNHYTTVKDMALILDYALKNNQFASIFKTKQYTDSKKKRTWNSSVIRASGTSKIDISHIDGAKSGFTDEAQLTLASLMTYEDHEFILVTAKAEGQRSQNHIKDASTVYTYLSKNYKKFILYKKDEKIHTYYILKSFEGFYDLKANQEISIILDNKINNDDVSLVYEGKTILSAPFETTEQLGKISVQYNEEELYQYDVHLTKSIEGSLIASLIHYMIMIIVIGFVALLMARKIYRIKRRKKKKTRN